MTTQVDRVTLIARFRALSGNATTVRTLITEYGGIVRQEPGNICFDVYTEKNDPQAFVVWEQYQDEKAFQAHLNGEAGKGFNQKLASLVEEGGSQLEFLRSA